MKVCDANQTTVAEYFQSEKRKQESLGTISSYLLYEIM